MAEEEGPCWVDIAYRHMRKTYHMTDDEFWHNLSLERLFALMGLDEMSREDEREMQALELAGF